MTSRPTIVVLNSSSFGNLFPEHLERLKGFADIQRLNVRPDISAAELHPQLTAAHGIILSVSPKLTSEVLENLPNLVAIARHGIGYDNVDVKAATKLGIVVSRVPGLVEQESVAEHTVALMLNVSRQLSAAREAVLKGAWNSRAQFIGVELKGKRVGLVGLGNIGSRVAEILSKGFGSDVVAFDPFLTPDEITSRCASRVSFEELITTSSIISLHCNLNDSSIRCLGEKEFSIIKKGAIIVNTARGELIDESALIRAIKLGYVGAYASDVIEGAPAPIDHPLLKLSNVFLVPHLGAYTIESLRGMGETMVNEMEEVFVHKRLPQNLIDRSFEENHLRKWAA